MPRKRFLLLEGEIARKDRIIESLKQKESTLNDRANKIEAVICYFHLRSSKQKRVKIPTIQIDSLNATSYFPKVRTAVQFPTPTVVISFRLHFMGFLLFSYAAISFMRFLCDTIQVLRWIY